MLSSDEKLFLVYNLLDGVDVYEFPDMVILRTIRAPSSHRFIKQVCLAKDSTMVLQGSEMGRVFIADLKNGLPLCSLDLPGENLIVTA